MALWGKTDALASVPTFESYIETFDGSATTVDHANNRLVFDDHQFTSGDKVVYSDGPSGSINGITDGDVRFVKVIDKNNIELYEGFTAPNTFTTIDALSAGSNGTGHQLKFVPQDIYFVDTTESQVAGNRVKGFSVPGWYRYSETSGFETAGTALGIHPDETAIKAENTTGKFKVAPAPIEIGDQIIISGTDAGSTITGYTNNDDYIVTEIHAGHPGQSVTSFTIQEDGAQITTVAENTDGLTFTLKKDIGRNNVELLCAFSSSGATGTATQGTDGVDGDDDSVVASAATFIAITGQLADVSYNHGGSGNGNANFQITMTCTGSGVVACQLQESTDGGTTFANIGSAVNSSAGGSAVTLPVAITDTSKNGFKYRAVLTSALADTVTSAVKTLTVT